MPDIQARRVLNKGAIASLVCGAAATCLLGASTANAAAITFATPATFTDTSVLDGPLTGGGTFVEAKNIGDGTNHTVNTIGGNSLLFAGMPGSLGDADMPAPASGTSGFYNGGGQWSFSIFPGDTGSSNFNDVLRGNAWHNNGSDAARPLTVRLGNLTIGGNYSVLLFSVDQRSGSAGRAQAYWDGFSVGGGFSGNTSGSYPQTSPHVVVGTFVADAAYQDIFIQETDGAGNDDTHVSAYALYTLPVPEPASLALAAFGGLALLTRRRSA